MTISIATASDCCAVTLSALDLDAPGLSLFSPEALTASLRRAASFLCPAAPRQIVDYVLDALRPLQPDEPLEREDLNDLVELLVSAGDLIELPPDPQRRGRLLYLGPPSFVEKRSGHYLLMGVRPFGAALLPGGLADLMRRDRHVRTVELDRAGGAKQLRSAGLHMIAPERWVAAPARETPEEVLAAARARLDSAGPAGNVAGLTILDPTRTLRYYRGRWHPPTGNDTGDFVARRSQEYGSDLWCYIRIEAGRPVSLIDFPISDPTVPGRDDAWRLQAAIDAKHGNQHVYRLSASQVLSGHTLVDFLAPVPTWAERYLELVGTAVSEVRGALFSYLVPDDAVARLTDYLAGMLWMRAAMTGGTR